MLSLENTKRTTFLFIDIQEKLITMLPENIRESLLKNVKILHELSTTFKINSIITEQYPQGLGKTTKSLIDNAYQNKILEKIHFDCCNDTNFNAIQKKHNSNIFVISGIETHICVLQTACGLLKQKKEVIIVADAVASRSKQNWKMALDFLKSQGAAILPTETLVFLLLEKAATPEFKKFSSLIK